MLILGLIVILVHVVSCLTLDKRIEYKEISFDSAKAPAEMDGYKIVLITDTHAITAQELENVVIRINRWEPDLLILGGDFPSGIEALKRSMEILSKIETTDGIYGVEGNHDNHIELFAAMGQYSMHPLSNSGARIRERFYLAGVEDLWNRSPNVEKAIQQAHADDFLLLVSHNPDVTMKQDTTTVDLILSGHTHGGHITFFGIWAPALTLRNSITDYGQRFLSGWAVSRDGVPVYVSHGAGTFENIPRIFARPQVILITLRAAGNP
jgi:hypothetical protein